MFDSWLLKAGKSRWRTFACVAVALGLFACFWSDFCLWRADASLSRRDESGAQAWVERSRWLGRKVDPQLCLLQLRIARRRQDFHEVERLLREAARVGVPRLEVQRERLLALAQTNQFEAMQAHWQELLADARSDGPEIARAYYTWLMLHHDLRQAEQTLKLWHADYPEDPEPMALAGRYYEAMVNWKGAEESYREALALAPGNEEYRLAYANALQVQLKTKEAIPLYEEYLTRHPDDLVAMQGLAQCLANDGELQSALELLKRAYESHPDDFATQRAYGDLLLTSGDAVTAVPILEKAYQAVPEHANLANSLARAYKATGRAAEARPLFDFVVESRPKLDELIHLEERLRNEPENLELRMQIAAVTARFVSRRDAIRWYQALLQVAPGYAPAHEALLDLYQKLGEESLAESHARWLQEKSPAAGKSDGNSVRNAAKSK